MQRSKQTICKAKHTHNNRRAGRDSRDCSSVTHKLQSCELTLFINLWNLLATACWVKQTNAQIKVELQTCSPTQTPPTRSRARPPPKNSPNMENQNGEGLTPSFQKTLSYCVVTLASVRRGSNRGERQPPRKGGGKQQSTRA